MRIKQTVFCFLLASVLSLGALPKNAHGFTEIGTGFIVTNYQSLITTFVLSLPADERPERYIDGYARLFDCDLVLEHFRNEFDWRNIRERINRRINQIEREYFSYYEFIGTVDLGSYNFEAEVFPLHSGSQLNGVRLLNVYRYPITMHQGQQVCSHAFGGRSEQRIRNFLPTAFGVRLPSSIHVRQISMPPDVAENFVRSVESDERGRRRVYLRFRIRLDAISELRMDESVHPEVIFNGQVLELDVFADRDMNHHLAKLEI